MDDIDIRPLTPTIGAEIGGIDIGKGVSDSQLKAVHRALLDHGVIFLRDQEMTLDQHKAFGRYFGDLHVHPENYYPVEGHPEIFVVKADENSKYIAGEGWHSDVSCEPMPAMGSILHVQTVPEGGGGDTLFANMYAAYDALSDAMKGFLGGLTAIHDGGPNYRAKTLNPDPDKVYPMAEHPVIRTHPETGRKTIFVNSYFTQHIVQLATDESRAVLDMLYRHVAKPEWQCRFKWRKNSIAFWDNRCVQHNAIWDYYPQRRFGYRVTVCGDKPF